MLECCCEISLLTADNKKQRRKTIIGFSIDCFSFYYENKEQVKGVDGGSPQILHLQTQTIMLQFQHSFLNFRHILRTCGRFQYSMVIHATFNFTYKRFEIIINVLPGFIDDDKGGKLL